MKQYNIYLTGVGGQGILTIADIIMRSAEMLDLAANFFPTKGMAQRGGFVKAQVKLGQSIVGPDIREGGGDLGIAMELSESLRALRYLKPGADFIVYGFKWQPTEVMLGKAPYPGVEEVAAQAKRLGINLFYLDPAELPEGAADNIYLLGACLTHSRLGEMLPVDTVRQAIASRWPKGAERNMLSFDAGLAK